MRILMTTKSKGYSYIMDSLTWEEQACYTLYLPSDMGMVNEIIITTTAAAFTAIIVTVIVVVI